MSMLFDEIEEKEHIATREDTRGRVALSGEKPVRFASLHWLRPHSTNASSTAPSLEHASAADTKTCVETARTGGPGVMFTVARRHESGVNTSDFPRGFGISLTLRKDSSSRRSCRLDPGSFANAAKNPRAGGLAQPQFHRYRDWGSKLAELHDLRAGFDGLAQARTGPIVPEEDSDATVRPRFLRTRERRLQGQVPVTASASRGCRSGSRHGEIAQAVTTIAPPRGRAGAPCSSTILNHACARCTCTAPRRPTPRGRNRRGRRPDGPRPETALD